MRELLTSELDRVSGGLRLDSGRGPKMHPDLYCPYCGQGGGGGGPDWGDLSIDSGWWGGDTNGSWAGTNSFNFFGPDNNAPSTDFFFNETDGIGKLSVAVPNFNGGGAVPLGTYQGTPNGPDLEFGVQGTWHLDNGMTIDVQGGVFSADPLHPHGTAVGAKFTVKF